MNPYTKICNITLISVLCLSLLSVILNILHVEYNSAYIILPQLTLMFIQGICCILDCIDFRKQHKEFIEMLDKLELK